MGPEFYRMAILATAAVTGGFVGMMLAAGIALILWAVKDDAAPAGRRGRRVKRLDCPACGQQLSVPAALPQFICPYCREPCERHRDRRRWSARLIRRLMTPGSN
jgi:hypothetical protein